jgi:hypothetical protein
MRTMHRIYPWEAYALPASHHKLKVLGSGSRADPAGHEERILAHQARVAAEEPPSQRAGSCPVCGAAVVARRCCAACRADAAVRRNARKRAESARERARRAGEGGHGRG